MKKSKSKNKGKLSTELELVLEQTQQEHQSDTKVFTMTIEILLEPISNKLLVDGNPIKEILLKLNLPDHRSILTDSKMDVEVPGSSRLTRFIATCSYSIDIYKDIMKVQNALAEYMILSGADNRPPMLDKDLEWCDQNKKYAELFAAEKIQADCDMKATNIILQAVASSRFPSTNNKLRTSSNLRNQATIQDGRVIVQQVQERQGQNYLGTGYTSNATSYGGNTSSGQARVIKCYNYQEVSHSETYLNDMENQSVHAMPYFKQTPAVDVSNNKIHSDSNIIPYSKYLEETQQENVQDTYLQAQQVSIILFVIEQMSEQIINHVNNWEKANKKYNNELETAKLERYKERVKTFEKRLNIDLSSQEKMIDFQMDDMIREKLAMKQQVNSLEQNLSKQIKEKV
nr:hypothetical protein [Tanacetum cinerariifolium]